MNENITNEETFQKQKNEKVSFKEGVKLNLNNFLGTKPKSKNGIVLKTTARITYIALLTALSTLFNIGTFYPVKYFALSFTAIPCFIAGIMLGPISGFAVGFLGDLVGALIAPQGPYMPMIGIASGLFGLIPGLIFLLFRFHPHLKILVSYILCLIICTCCLNTVNLWLVYSAGEKTLATFWIYLKVRLPFQIAVCAINWFLTTVLYVCLVKAKVIKRVSYKKQIQTVS